MVGASALVVGFASPALAAGSINGPTGGNASASNEAVVVGGSNTTYSMMVALGDTFNAAPGCDLASSTFVQPLDYGCPGINDAGGTLSQDATTTYNNVTVTSGGTKISIAAPGFVGEDAFGLGTNVTDTAHLIPAGTYVKKVYPIPTPPAGYTAAPKLKLSAAATGSSTTDTVTIVTTPGVGENGFLPWGNENPFNDVLVNEPAIGSSNGILQLEDQGTHGVGAHASLKVSGDVSVVSGSNVINITGTGSFAGTVATDAISDTAGDIPAGTTVTTVNSATQLTLSANATGTDATDTVTITQPINVSALDAARSSRAPKTSDYKGLNFVAYAMDGVSWFHWTKVGTTSTPSASVTDLSLTQINQIWSNTLTCNVGGTVYNENWICLGGSNAPIALYMAQNGSGTESTWATLANLTGSFPFGGEDIHHVIFENQTESIINNGDEANAIFFFSYGKYTKTCHPTLGYCGAAPTGWAGGTIALGTIGGTPVNQSTIQAQLPWATGTVFAGDRLLYNVYSDGSNSTNIPTASLATLNAVSEDGFLCKPSTSSDIDPNTGSTYLSEIDSTISGQGFFPLPLMIEDGNGAANNPANPVSSWFSSTGTGIPAPAWNELGGSKYDSATEAGGQYQFPAVDRDTDNSAVSGSYTGLLAGPGGSGTSGTASSSNPIGYCLVLSTDGNATA